MWESALGEIVMGVVVDCIALTIRRCMDRLTVSLSPFREPPKKRMIIDSVQTNNIKIDVGKVSLVLSLIDLLFNAGP